MCMRVILHGNLGRESDAAREVLKASGVPYRFDARASSPEPPTVITPGGTYRGLDAIRGLFGTVVDRRKDQG